MIVEMTGECGADCALAAAQPTPVSSSTPAVTGTSGVVVVLSLVPSTANDVPSRTATGPPDGIDHAASDIPLYIVNSSFLI
ncbi:MAG TPA: hypothetical protein VMT00_12865 [Thermoanaerobaculia bacterium]|nr:hypothetical protein [Thermoanaerobaculia bacterium]